jgi:predicted Fe-Mo cluster-binding NifX family protein
MTIAITSTGESLESNLDPRFGRAEYYIILNKENGEIIKTINNSENMETSGGAGTLASQIMSENNVQAVISSNFGPNATKGLNALNIKMLQSSVKKIKDVFRDFREGNLTAVTEATVAGHH